MVFILQWNNATNEEPCSTEPNVCIGYYVILCRFCVFQFLSRAFTCEKFYTIYFVCILVCVCMHGNRPGSVYGTGWKNLSFEYKEKLWIDFAQRYLSQRIPRISCAIRFHVSFCGLLSAWIFIYLPRSTKPQALCLWQLCNML